jgi:hypothetical protein
MKTKSSSTTTVKILRWTARIIGTLMALIMISLRVGEAIEKGGLQVSGAGHWTMFIFGMLAQLGIFLAWKWEGLGGILTASAMFIAILIDIFWVQGEKVTNTIIAFSFWFIPAFLFIYCWWRTNKQSVLVREEE